MVGDLSRRGVLARREDDADRRRRIIDIATVHRRAIAAWLEPGAAAWQVALTSLNPAQRRAFVDTLRTYEKALTNA